MTIFEKADYLIKIIENAGYEAYLVGGCVRDFFMNKPCNDIDITTSAKPIELEKILTENKIKYIDMLTSLKNRNYLNSAIEKWDESEIYPQTIMIIDLNNIAYINDNEVIVKYESAKAVTPGQACVIYLGSEVIGGGIIKEVRKDNTKLWYL
mgnify:CR=1 FL=1